MKDQNSFLYAISALGSINSTDYGREFSNLCLETGLSEDVEVWWEKIKFVRILQSLGHIEVDENKTLFICPHMLTLVRKGSTFLSVITGARTPFLIEKITEYIEKHTESVDLIIVEQRHPLASNGVHLLIPDAVFIKSKKVENLKELAKAVHIDYQLERPVSEILLGYSNSLSDYRKTLKWDKTKNDDPTTSKERIFSLEKLSFFRKNIEFTEDHLAEYSFPYQPREYWLWESGLGAKVQRDWGRFLLLNKKKKNVLIYNRDSKWLAVPSFLPLPKVLSRALTLCSGLAPLEVRSGDISKHGLPYGIPFEIFFLVPQNVAEESARLLGQELILKEITPHPDLCKLISI